MRRSFIITSVLLMSCSHISGDFQNIALTINDHTISLIVEIADEPVERAEGMMGRESMPENQGMLFVFQEPRPLSFWMKNTKIPLDILFFDKNKNFIKVLAMDPCKNEPCPTYTSGQKATYALEVNAGFFAEHITPHLKGLEAGPLRLRFPAE